MKINFIKQAGGALIPASDIDSDQMTKYKTNEMYEVDIKLSRNPAFLRKAFAFFNFCFEHWTAEGEYEHMNNKAQFEVFRSHLTVLAGYYDQYVGIHGDIRVEAKSLSFSSMTEEEFSDCYSALINAACKHIFHSTDTATYNRLITFF